MSILDQTAPILEAEMTNFLRQFGLEELASWAATMVGKTGDEFVIELEKQPLYRERFAPVFERREQIAAGDASVPITPENVLEAERRDRELEQEFGLPEGTIDTGARLVADVSAVEMRDRVQTAVEDVRTVYADEAGRAYLEQEFAANPSLTEGGIVALFLDPEVSLPKLRNAVESASVAAGANAAGFRLSNSEADRLADLGLTQEGARQGFGEVDALGELTESLIGEQDEGLTRDELIAFAGGDPIMRNRLEGVRRRRVAQFAGGGGFSGGTQGIR